MWRDACRKCRETYMTLCRDPSDPAYFAHHLRARLSSFPHAYAIAVRLRYADGARRFVVRTDDPIQPVQVSELPPDDPETLLAIVA